MAESRIDRRFAELRAEGRGGLIAFVTAGDPNLDVCREILSGLPASGADMIEIGMPFSDPMADGPTIQDSSRRALKAGGSMGSTLRLVRDFRGDDQSTPVVLMGYFNPIYSYGIDAFIADAIEAGADGLIVVDMPPEEEAELAIPALEKGLDFIYLSTPTTDEARLDRILAHASGFLYHVSIAGVTGAKSANLSEVQAAVARMRRQTALPIAIGFGIKTPDEAREMASVGDAAVVGSALVALVEDNIDEDGNPKETCAKAVLDFVAELARGVAESKRQGAA